MDLGNAHQQANAIKKLDLRETLYGSSAEFDDCLYSGNQLPQDVTI